MTELRILLTVVLEANRRGGRVVMECQFRRCSVMPTEFEVRWRSPLQEAPLDTTTARGHRMCIEC